MQISVMWTVKAVGLGVVAVSLSWELLTRFLRHLRPERTLHEVLFFPSETVCVEHLFAPSSLRSCLCSLPHGIHTPFSRLLGHIMSASSSLDLCIFSFSNADLSRAVVALHRRGVTIRVFTDKDYSAITGTQIGFLRKAGICVRCNTSGVHMHHKFAVVDGWLLLTGSLNWTLTAVQHNMENVLVTQEPELVRPFIAEFNRLWALHEQARLLRQ